MSPSSASARFEIIDGLPAQARFGVPGTLFIVGLLIVVFAATIDSSPQLTQRQIITLIIGGLIAAFGLGMLVFRWWRAARTPVEQQPRVQIDHAEQTVTLTGFKREYRRFVLWRWGAVFDVSQTIRLSDIRSVCVVTTGGRIPTDSLTIVTDDHRFVVVGSRHNERTHLAHRSILAAVPGAADSKRDANADTLYGVLLLFGALTLFFSLLAVFWRPLARWFNW